MRRTVTSALLVAGLLGAVAPAAQAASLPQPGAEKPTFKTIPASLFGMHVHALKDPSPNLQGATFGSVRIWDNDVRWDQVNTAPGVYDWTKLDQVVTNAKAAGAERIVYVLGGTPTFAAKYPAPPAPYFGGATSSEPNPTAWGDWVKEVVKKYRGQIDAYQIWNEANLTSMFYAGGGDSAAVMAELTKQATDIIRAEDPGAEVATASSTVQQTKGFATGWYSKYLQGLRSRGVKPDAISVHLYPWLKQGPGNGTIADRAKGLDMAKQVIAKAKFTGLPIWDTEMNYGNNRPNGHPKKVYSQSLGAAYLAQTYLQSLTNGVAQVDWYGFDDYGLGIWLTDPKTGALLQPGKAYENLKGWLAGARDRGCTTAGKVTVCGIQRGSAKQYVVYSSVSKAKTYTVPASWKVKRSCDVLNVCKPIKRGQLAVGISPLLLKK